jgi:hypothetical protein
MIIRSQETKTDGPQHCISSDAHADCVEYHSLDLDEIRKQVEKITATPPFVRAPLLARMLDYLVEHTLSRASGYLKEYTIGVELLGKGDSFDPRLDAIVRVHAVRLRKKLAEFYQGIGNNDRVVILLPSVGYTPVIRWRSDMDSANVRDSGFGAWPRTCRRRFSESGHAAAL